MIASLPKFLGFKCNPLLFNSFEVTFPLSMTSNCKPCKYSFGLITVKEAVPLSVRVIKLEMMLHSGKVFSDKFLWVKQCTKCYLGWLIHCFIRPNILYIISISEGFLFELGAIWGFFIRISLFCCFWQISVSWFLIVFIDLFSMSQCCCISSSQYSSHCVLI